MNNLEKSIKRNTSKGRLAKDILAVVKPQELQKIDEVFGRPAPSYADVELHLLPLLRRADNR